MAIGRTPRAKIRSRRAIDDGAEGFIPYEGAIANIDLGVYAFTTTGIITGGTFTDGTLTIVGGDLSTTGTITAGNVTIGSLSGILKASTGVVSGAAALDDLTDVNASAPTDNDSLTWDSGTSKWIPEAVGAGALDDLTDVNASAPTDNDSLTWDSGTSKWIPEAVSAGFVPYTGATEDVDLGTGRTITAAQFKTNSPGGQLIMGGMSITSTGVHITLAGTDLVSVGDLGVGTGTPDMSLQVVGDSKFGDDNTNYATIGTTGDLTFVGTAGLQFGSCFAELPSIWTQANAVQDTWYNISDADFQDGELHGITHNGNGQLTVAVAGRYTADWAGAIAADAIGVHVRVTFSINGTEGNPGMNHMETVAVNKEFPCSGLAILDLAANDTVNISIKTTDSGTPDLAVEHLMFRLIQIGGT